MKRTLGHRPLVHDAGRLKTFLGTTGGGSGTGPADATYLTLSLHADLSSERKFVGGDGLVSNDGGANGDFTLSVDLAGTSGLELTGVSPNKDLQLADSVAGDGLAIANKVLAVNVGVGLTISEDAVSVAWQGNPTTIVPDANTAGGSSNYAARTDHTHAIICAAPGTIQPDHSATEGTSTSFARADHRHANACAAPGANITVSTTKTEGTSTSFARADHGHAVTTSSNPAATASILASDAAGKVQLVGLGIGAAATDAAVKIQETTLDHLYLTRGIANEYVTYNLSSDEVLTTDFYNAAKDTYWRVENSSSYRVHLGLNCVGDAQFDLDIGGNIRAQGWIVGKHAIQLGGALGIFHYDGPEPFESNFAGTCTGHMGQVATTSGGVIFRPGKLQKGVQIAEATTNLVTNPSCETGNPPTGFSEQNTPTTFERSVQQAYVGTHSLMIVADASGEGLYFTDDTNFDASTQYTFSVSLRGFSGGEEVRLAFYDADGGWQYDTTRTLTTEWQRFSYTATFSTGATRSFGVVSVSSTPTWFSDAFQMEQKAYATPFADGSLGLIADGAWRDGEPGTEGHYWNGAANASTSSRVAATLHYDDFASTLFQQQGSALGWYIVGTDPSAKTDSVLFEFWTSANERLLLDVMADEQFDLYINGAWRVTGVGSGSLSEGDEVFWCVSWDFVADEYLVAVYESGTMYSGYSTASLYHFAPTKLTIGGDNTDAYPCNGIIDDVAFLDNCILSLDGTTVVDDQALAVYESEAPVFAETSSFQFSAGPSQLVWADHEGLWARADDGGAALGLFCGEGTKSWGGFTMGPADLVLGANVSGSAAIHWDQSTGKFGFYGNANATVQVEIGTDGSIIAASGNLKLNSSGIQIISTGTYGDVRSFQFVDATPTVHATLKHYQSATTNMMMLTSYAITSKSSQVNIDALSPTTGGSESAVGVNLSAHGGTGKYSILQCIVSQTNVSQVYLSADSFRVSANLRLDGGLYVGTLSDADDNDIWVVNDARIGGGLYVGSVATDPAADDIWCDGYISTDGGTTKWGLGSYTGGVSTPTGYIVVNVAGTSYQLSARPS